MRDLAGLDEAVAKRVILAVERAAGEPRRAFKRLQGSDDSRMRVGDWRVIAALAHKSRAVLVKRVGHRSSIYRR